MQAGVWFNSKNKITAGLVIAFLLLAGSLYTVNYYSSGLQIGMRSFNFGSSQFMKSQQHAVNELVQFIHTEETEHIEAFYNHIKVVERLKQGRDLLVSESGSSEEIIKYLHLGDTEPHGVKELVRLYDFFSHTEIVQQLISIWQQTDQKVADLQLLANELTERSNNGELNQETKQEYLTRIYALTNEITELDQKFFSNLNRAGVWIDQIVNQINLAAIVILVLLLGSFTWLQLRTVRKWNEKISESEKKFKVVLNNSQDVIYQMDLETGKYVYMSPSAENMLGYDIEKLKEGGAEFMLKITHPEDLKRMEEQVESYKSEDLEQRLADDTQFRVKKKNGEYIWANNKRTLLRDLNGNPKYIIGNVRDISERKKYVDALDQSLKEKEMLLSEIHHRVKNNLSIVSSLIELQKGTREEITEADLKDIQDRIRSIALVHEKLYQAETLAEVDLSIYIEDLLKMIELSLGSKQKNVEIVSDLDSIIIDNKKAVPVGLLINELVNNCYKYAFLDKESGEIHISLKKKDQDVLLKVEDNGAGLPANFEEKSKESLGMTLVRAFTRQLKGDLDFKSDQGTKFKIQFELPAKNGEK
ncbi:sensor histidine kinase [Rhodohalobacter sp.]|uniref:sensor histidine kinase n=1 Tax=Rhodohalobacter sp. TaxID=1974210 RepID=UPI002ACDFA74|nr:histidine kinase dimerization/phosphoacceptor domain -containing protein [Rhodohalobacter sp.]MDZ7755684.1 histidine kinase dimerization/phosphoacceptor domain -containing protein [Rhodohalobacter sp.]